MIFCRLRPPADLHTVDGVHLGQGELSHAENRPEEDDRKGLRAGLAGGVGTASKLPTESGLHRSQALRSDQPRTAFGQQAAETAERLGVECYAFPMRVSRTNRILIRIGTEIRRRRQKLRISQGMLATRAGVHLNVVGRIERGIYNPTVMTLDAIANALNASMVDLLRGAFK